jgi:hypothetical protein
LFSQGRRKNKKISTGLIKGSKKIRKAKYPENKKVPGKGLEPPCLATHVPETCVSTNFTTRAAMNCEINTAKLRQI